MNLTEIEQQARKLAVYCTYEYLNDLLAGLLSSRDDLVAKDALRVLQRALSLRAAIDFTGALDGAERHAEALIADGHGHLFEDAAFGDLADAAFGTEPKKVQS